mmetsp:Transcript_6279/g.22988  ORF Transcript_6279/g.22988 Transcript_6279/m.22988 type:complete len:90 (+) Transcript_6279:242-511(+)
MRKAPLDRRPLTRGLKEESHILLSCRTYSWLASASTSELKPYLGPRECFNVEFLAPKGATEHACVVHERPIQTVCGGKLELDVFTLRPS